jgi:outer membrane lipoprotein SlyB
MRHAIGGALLVAAFGLAGCAYPVGPNAYHGYEAGAEQTVRFGVVESLKPVRIQVRDTGVGTTAGAVIGGVAGSHVGGGSGQVVGAIGGAILGGLIGTDIERANNARAGVELTVLLDSGKYISVVQPEDEPFRAGDRVRILSGRGSTRVTH